MAAERSDANLAQNLRYVFPILLGIVVGIAFWAVEYFLAGIHILFLAAPAAVGIGAIFSLLLYAFEILSPARSDFVLTPEYAEYTHLRGWLYYWVIIVVLVFGLCSAFTILILGVIQGGPLVIGVAVPITTIFFLVLLSRYSSRSFSHDVRTPLRALQEHITKMDNQSIELNVLVGKLVESTTRLAASTEQLVELERASPDRRRKEAEAQLPHLWFRAFGTPPALVSVEIENRGDLGTIARASLDFGYGSQPLGGIPRVVAKGERFTIQAGSMHKNTKALQLRIACVVQSEPPGRTSTQSAAFDCTQLKSFWGTPQGVSVIPPEPQDGLRGTS